MLVRIRVRVSQGYSSGLSSRAAFMLLSSALLTPATALALALALWRLGADLNLTGRFLIDRGLFSHWQVWLFVAAVLQGAAVMLGRKARASRRPQQRSYHR